MTQNVSIANPIDTGAGALVQIDGPHHEIHLQRSYVVTDVQNVNATTMKWQISTPATNYNHTIFDITCTGECSVVITEGSDRTDGAALEEINRFRPSTNTSDTVVTRTPTDGTSDGATTIFQKRAGASGGFFSSHSPGQSRGLNEFVLKPSTKYVVAIETFADVYVTFSVSWYSHS